MTSDTSKTSSQEEENPSDLFVLDFLYHDARRVGSFLSQLEGDGYLQQMVRTKTGARGKKEGSGHNVKASAAVASGTMQGNIETSVDMNEGYSKTFDPYWTNARALLDLANERELIKRDISVARIGQLVMVTGWLSILDLVTFKEAWKLPAIAKKIKTGSEAGKLFSQMTAAQKAEAKENKENTELFVEMMQILPHAIHASLLSSGDVPTMTWCALKEEYLVSSASDLTLAHGSTLGGEWTIFGILSATPEFQTADLTGQMDLENVGVMQSLVGQLSATLAPIVRVALGRPAAAYAITPLLIFREVS